MMLEQTSEHLLDLFRKRDFLHKSPSKKKDPMGPHVWYVYLHLVDFMVNVGKYAYIDILMYHTWIPRDIDLMRL